MFKELDPYQKEVVKRAMDIINAKCVLHKNDLIRYTDPSNCNTIYRVTRVQFVKKGEMQSWGAQPPEYKVTLKPIFGLFKQDYKLSKTTTVRGGELRGDMIKLDLMELGLARNRLDLFIQQEAKRLSGEDVSAPT